MVAAAYALIVRFKVKPQWRQRFLDLVRENAATSVRDESDCLRFDIIDPGAEDDVYLYEIYSDRAAFDAHIATPHFKSFDAATRVLIDGKRVITGAFFEHAKA